MRSVLFVFCFCFGVAVGSCGSLLVSARVALFQIFGLLSSEVGFVYVFSFGFVFGFVAAARPMRFKQKV